jgi:DNA-directed RNA polymerase subunit RPC12/RpoP
MTRIYTCPKCKTINKIEDNAQKGDEYICIGCEQKVRLRNYLGWRVKTVESP